MGKNEATTDKHKIQLRWLKLSQPKLTPRTFQYKPRWIQVLAQPLQRLGMEVDIMWIMSERSLMSGLVGRKAVKSQPLNPKHQVFQVKNLQENQIEKNRSFKSSLHTSYPVHVCPWPRQECPGRRVASHCGHLQPESLGRKTPLFGGFPIKSCIKSCKGLATATVAFATWFQPEL